MVPLFMMPGGPELFVVLGILVLLFGADKLPKLARSSGRAMGEFKRGRDELEDDLRGSVEEEREAATETAD